jgi:hypothetical protein
MRREGGSIFPTRIEALLNSVRVAASMALVLIFDTTKDHLFEEPRGRYDPVAMD